MTKFLLHQTNQNGLSHVIKPQEVYLLVPTLWLNSVKLKGVSSRFITKHTKTNDTSTSVSFTQHNSYFVKNKIIILFFLFFLLILLAIDKCNRASSLAISVSQHCERAFRTPFICLCAPYMKRHSLRRSIEPKEGHKTTGASKNIFSILYLMYRSKCSL